MTLTFDFLAKKSNQHIYKCKYMCDQNWFYWEIWCDPPTVTLTFDRLR